VDSIYPRRPSPPPPVSKAREPAKHNKEDDKAKADIITGLIKG